MKKLIFAVLIMAATTTQAQNAKLDSSTGNYVTISHDANKEPGKPTGKTITDNDGNVFPVLETSKGRLYYVRVSKKTGKEYKAYLKL